MKKILLSVAALSMIIGATVLTSCKKTDTTPPTITITGANPLNIYLQAGATDPGATAVDNSGNNITSSIVSTWSASSPNQNLVGAYTVTYTATDANGNTGTATRTVNVANQAAPLAGNYTYTDNVTGDTTEQFTNVACVVSASSSVNNNIIISNFDNFGTNITVTATLNPNNNTLAFASQTPTGAPGWTILGTGTTNSANTQLVNTSTTVDSASVAETDDCSYSLKSRVRLIKK
jgi:hypothetical protein